MRPPPLSLTDPTQELQPVPHLARQGTSSRVDTRNGYDQDLPSVLDSTRTNFSPNRAHVLTSLRARPSAYALAEKLLQDLPCQQVPASSYDAIPDAISTLSAAKTNFPHLVPVTELLGCDLPPADVSITLFNVFARSVQWFMMIFHEPSVRAEMQSILDTKHISPHKLSLAVLILVILLIGTKYTKEAEALGLDLTSIESKLLERIESKFLAVLDENNVGTVQVCILLSSFYFYHGRPSRCLALNSMAIKIAQTLKFDFESTWTGIDLAERENRRRAWWNLYVFDGHAALTYGTRNTIQKAMFDVEMPQDIDNLLEKSSSPASCGPFEMGSLLRSTTLSYHRYKFRLYRIAEPIMRELYSLRQWSVQDLAREVQSINQQLLAWEEDLPVELKPGSYSSHFDPPNVDSTSMKLPLQALVLQISYDNIQLILHRRLLVETEVLSLKSHHSKTQQNLRMTTNVSAKLLATSTEQCWESAKRTSLIEQHSQIAQQLGNSPAAGYIGVQCFMAGVMLGIFALSLPFTTRASEAKCGLGRLIKTPGCLGYRTKISDQTGRILERLLRLIVDEEVNMLTSKQSPQVTSFRPSTQEQRLPQNSRGSLTDNGEHMETEYTTKDNRDLQEGSGHQLCSPTAVEISEIPSTGARHDIPHQKLSTRQPDNGGNDLDNHIRENWAGDLDAMNLDSSFQGLFSDADLLTELDELGQSWMLGQSFRYS